MEGKLTKGIWSKELALKVYVIKKVEEDSIAKEVLIPPEFEGIKTDVETTGRIMAQTHDGACYNPARGGASIGHLSITAGTFGCLVRRSNKIYILSNNHVLANSNNAKPGDYIFQPGPSDGGMHNPVSHPGACTTSDRCIATLTDFEPLDFSGGNNLIDAAIAEPINHGRRVHPSIISIGRVKGIIAATRGMGVMKRGRTTKLTYGEITSINSIIRVDYGIGEALFTGQLAIRGNPPPFSRGGDSGSLIVDTAERKAVGLLFAGSDTITFANPIDLVLQRFNAEIIE